MSILDVDSNLPEGSVPFRIRRSISQRVLRSQLVADQPEVRGKLLWCLRKKRLSTSLRRKHFQDSVDAIRIVELHADAIHADGVDRDVVSLSRLHNLLRKPAA